MIHTTGATARTAIPFAADFSNASVTVSAQSALAAQAMTVQQLRNSHRPPFDHADYTLPLKSVADNWRLAELDAHIAFLRSPDVYGMEEDAAPLIYEQQRQSLMVTREAVQGFLDNGDCPQDPSECKALALYLLTNKLFGALTWLVVQSKTDMLDLSRCGLGNEEVGKVAEWLRTIPFKVKLDLSNNEMNALGAGLLAEALEAESVEHLNLGINPLGDEGVQLVCAGLSRNRSLQSLLLYHVGTTGAGLRAIASVLDTHPSLSMLNLSGSIFDDAAAAILAAALAHDKVLTSLTMHHSIASDAGLSMLVGALKTNTALLSLRVSLSKPGHQHLPIVLAEALEINQTLTVLEVFFGVITNEEARRLAAAVARNTALRSFKCRLAAYGLTKENTTAVKQIKDKVKANALIESAGNALTELSQRPEWTVPVPPEIGLSIAAFAAQVAADERRSEAMRSIGQSGPSGSKNALG